MSADSQTLLRRVPVLDAREATSWDHAAREAGIPSRVLMESAGRAAAHVVAELFGPKCMEGTLVVVGHGNNGGDGWVIARALHAVGAKVAVVEYDKERSTDCAANRELALRDGVSVLEAKDEWPRAEIVVDALLGTGAAGQPKGAVGDLSHRVMQLGVPVVAVDGPTGLDLTTGQTHGPVRADLTVTFGGFRRGHLLARDWCGRIVVLDIGFGQFPASTDWPLFVHDIWAAATVPPLESSMHKGKRGRVAVIGGEDGMAGAVQYAARAAFAAGAGLVRIAAPPCTVASMQENLPDVTATQTALGPTVEDAVAELLAWADAVVVGPGLGRGDDRTEFVRGVLDRVECPVVLDADALHVGSGDLKRGTAPRVLTPHFGEFRGAFLTVEDAASDRFAAAIEAAEMFADDSAVLLKGVPTVLASGGDVRVVAAGNPGLATGGSGDVLSGLIAAFLARGLTPIDAASLGAQALGRSAELLAEKYPVRSMRPADVLASLADVWVKWSDPTCTIPPVLIDLPSPKTD